MDRARLSLFCWVWLAALRAQPAAAEPAPERPENMRVVTTACEAAPFDRAALVQQLGVELRALGIVIAEDPTDVAARSDGNAAAVALRIRCNPDGSAAELDLWGSAHPAARVVRLDDVPAELRPRTIAIAAGELVEETWPAARNVEASSPSTSAVRTAENSSGATPPPSAATTADPIVPVGEPPVADVAVDADDAATAPLVGGVDAAVTGWSFPNRDTALLGPAALGWVGFSHLRVSLGGHVVFGEIAEQAGSVNIRWASGFVGAGFTSGGTIRFGLEPRLYLGYGWAEGVPATDAYEGRDAARFMAAATLAGTVRAPLFRPLYFVANLEIGHAFHGVTFAVDDDPAAGLAQAMVGASVGLGYEWAEHTPPRVTEHKARVSARHGTHVPASRFVVVPLLHRQIATMDCVQ